MDGLPGKQGLYEKRFEHDACGIGMLVDTKGRRSHKLVCDAVEILENLTHRGGVGCEPETGDGAGILTGLPHALLCAAAQAGGFALPAAGNYGVAMVFASPDEAQCHSTLARFGAIIEAEGYTLLGVRGVPTYPGCLGKTAAQVCPAIHQVFIARPEELDEDAFERGLYILSKLATQGIRHAREGADRYFYLASISCRTIVYKGMLLPRQLAAFYLDLQDERFESAIALVHSRFSTNTFPSWERAHPMRHIIHNGEINTVQGNVNWVKARQAGLASELLGTGLARIEKLVDEEGSDSAMLDDYLALLVHAGHSLPQAVMLAIPEPWEHAEDMEPDKRAMYAYNACRSEPWDGPAAVAFTDGRIAGATLDRNGLRPARYTLTRDGVLILASEAGVLPTDPADIARKDRLRPGRMLLVDTVAGRIIEDEELKADAAAQHPYAAWLQENLLELDEWDAKQGGACATARDLPPLPGGEKPCGAGCEESATLSDVQRQKLYGYTYEDIDLLLRPMAERGEDPVGSMGYDAPLAVLSAENQLLYNYFKQLFAQVTNPPIDAIREKVVTSTYVQLGSEGNLLEPTPAACRMLRLPTPVLQEADMEKLAALREKALRPIRLPMLFQAQHGGGLAAALDALFLAADTAMDEGYNILILTDRGADAQHLPIPALLACSGLHHHLIRRGRRTAASLVVESGEAREVHHIAALVGYGANAVYPFMAYRLLRAEAAAGHLAVDAPAACARYAAALANGLVKVMSKMGISTVRSYHGAQIFEALGLGQSVVERYFTGTVTRIGGLGLREIEAEVRARCAAAFAPLESGSALAPGGFHKWRKQGEYHLFNPENIFYLQQACRKGDYALFKRFSECVNDRSRQLKNIRGLLAPRTAEKPLPLDAVESEQSILRRFKTGAMSYGSISREAHECMAIAMNRLGGKSNSGEGGEDPARYTPDASGDDRRSAIKQVASGRFGVSVHYLNNAAEIQIKMAQGAKPGEGGHLPGGKVYPWIAKARCATPGVELISPPPHHDIYSIEDLAQLIHDLKSANPAANISVKLVSEAGVGTVAVGVAKGLADVIVVSGYDGGTGAAPRTSIRHTGLPWELGLAEAHQTLLMNGLRGRVRLETDGKLLTGRDIVIAALLGAEEFAFATAPLVAMGCDMMRVCNLDTCPVGIATQNPELRARFSAKPEYVENLMRFLAREVREWMARIGVHSFEQLVGHAELLREVRAEGPGKAATVDLSRLLYQPTAASAHERYFTHPQDHGLANSMDENTLLPLCAGAIDNGAQVAYHLPISCTDRTVGALLSGAITRKHGAQGLPAGSVQLHFRGSAGQSFGAFLAPGVHLHLEGDTNDYLGKGISGGCISVWPPRAATFAAADNIIAGNVALYGATGGEAYIAGCAGERFAVRNSGCVAVVEGVGDHGCEYMTGGCVAVLGQTGRNFAAGMSGGIAYVLDVDGGFSTRVSPGRVELTALAQADEQQLKALLQRHVEQTGSVLAAQLLQDFAAAARRFVKVEPTDYARAQRALRAAHNNTNASEEERLMCAYTAVVGG